MRYKTNRKIIKFKCLFFKNVIKINKCLIKLMRKTKHTKTNTRNENDENEFIDSII